MSSHVPTQIPLAISLQEKPGFDLFVSGENVEVIQSIKSIARGIKKSSLYLWGKTGSGVSHLLQAACILADEAGQRIAYVPLRDHEVLDPQILDDMDHRDLVCIDDIDAISYESRWEQPLLHLYNRLRENNKVMLMGSHTSPRTLRFNLQDLKSRMIWDLVYHIKLLDDPDKIEMLIRRACARGFELPREVAEFIVRRVRRDIPSLISLLDQLEHATLAEQRKLTIPFVKSLLNRS